MIRYIVAGLLMLTGSRNVFHRDGVLPRQAVVTVYSCSHRTELIKLYGDSGMLTLIPNPFVTERDGSYSYFSNYLHDQEVIVIDGHVLGTIDNCGYDWHG